MLRRFFIMISCLPALLDAIFSNQQLEHAKQKAQHFDQDLHRNMKAAHHDKDTMHGNLVHQHTFDPFIIPVGLGLLNFSTKFYTALGDTLQILQMNLEKILAGQDIIFKKIASISKCEFNDPNEMVKILLGHLKTLADGYRYLSAVIEKPSTKKAEKTKIEALLTNMNVDWMNVIGVLKVIQKGKQSESWEFTGDNIEENFQSIEATLLEEQSESVEVPYDTGDSLGAIDMSNTVNIEVGSVTQKYDENVGENGEEDTRDIINDSAKKFIDSSNIAMAVNQIISELVQGSADISGGVSVLDMGSIFLGIAEARRTPDTINSKSMANKISEYIRDIATTVKTVATVISCADPTSCVLIAGTQLLSTSLDIRYQNELEHFWKNTAGPFMTERYSTNDPNQIDFKNAKKICKVVDDSSSSSSSSGGGGGESSSKSSLRTTVAMLGS